MRPLISVLGRLFLIACAVASVSAPVLGQSRSLSLSQSPKSAASNEDGKAAAMVQNLAKFQMAWGPGLNSPGATMRLKEISREVVPAGTVVTYRILTVGLPFTSTYDLVTAGFNFVSAPVLQGVTLDGTGLAICAGAPDTCGSPKKPNDPIDLKIFAATGEPKRFGLVSSDHLSKAFICVVPFPVQGIDQLCSVEAILLTQNAEALLILGTGFEPNSEVRVQSNSAGETQFATEHADDKGNFFEVQLPYVEGKSSGTLRITAKAKTCAPSLDFPWGKNTYRIQ